MKGAAYVPPEKVTGYLLNFDHKDGKGKAKFFTAFGFHAADPSQLAEYLITHYNQSEISKTVATPYGQKQIIEAPMAMPDGRCANVFSAWLIEQDGRARLLTAYPLPG